jgi:hypothetical protein
MIALRMFLKPSKSYLESRYLQNKAVENTLRQSYWIARMNDGRGFGYTHMVMILSMFKQKNHTIILYDVCWVRGSIFNAQKAYNWPPGWPKGCHGPNILTTYTAFHLCREPRYFSCRTFLFSFSFPMLRILVSVATYIGILNTIIIILYSHRQGRNKLQLPTELVISWPK